MIAVGVILAVLGGIALFVAYIMLIILAFRLGGAGWGIGSIFLGIIGLIFGIMHWNQGGRTPVLIYIVGTVVLVIGYGLIIAGAASSTTTTTSLLLN